MLIKLQPQPPNPSVLFNIAFEDLPDGLALPSSWTTHLSNLMHDELVMPRYQHALDKAAFLPCILEEVVFDIPAMSVLCRFVDGTIEQWKIECDDGTLGRLGGKCLKTLESVVEDVCLSSAESEREKERERQRERERAEKEKERLRLLQQPPSQASVKSTRHKKRRSLLMTIVSGLSTLNSMINLSLPSPTAPFSKSHNKSLPPTPPQPTVAPPTPPEYSELEAKVEIICPRLLRRRARSSLVDAFRLYVLYELTQRVPQGGYYVWVLHSLLTEAKERREAYLIREREREREREYERQKEMERERERLRATSPLLVSENISSSVHSSFSATTTCSSASSSAASGIVFGRNRSTFAAPTHSRGVSTGSENEAFSPTTASDPPFSDDEDDTVNHATSLEPPELDDSETNETDTDSSSLHTPTSSHFTIPSPPSSQMSHLTTQMRNTIPQPGCPTLQPLTDPTTLQIQTLTHLILLHTSYAAHMKHDDDTRLDALEIRSRRRAWLNRSLSPKAFRSSSSTRLTHASTSEMQSGAAMNGLGFAIPLRRSGLGMWVFGADEVDEFHEFHLQPHVFSEGLRIQTDAIMCEMEEGSASDKFAGFDERNGLSPRRQRAHHKKAQLLPVNEVEEEVEAGEALVVEREIHSQEVQIHNTHLDDLNMEMNLGQYDDLRALQMDLDIVTGAGFDLGTSDDEDELPVSMGMVGPDQGDGICVDLEIPFPKALHARSPHLIPSHERLRPRLGREKINNPPPYEDSFAQEGHAHTRLDLPPRSPTPLPQYPLPVSLSSSENSTVITLPQPAHLPKSPLAHSVSSNSLESLFTQPSVPSLDGRVSIAPGVSSVSVNNAMSVRVNELGEFVAHSLSVSDYHLGECSGAEFTLAMDLPSKSMKRSAGGFGLGNRKKSTGMFGVGNGSLPRMRGSLNDIGESRSEWM